MTRDVAGPGDGPDASSSSRHAGGPASAAERRRAQLLAAQAESGRHVDEAAHRRASRRSFVTGAAAASVGALTWRWVQTQPTDGRIPTALRRGHEANEALWRALGSSTRRAREYAPERARPLRVNGTRGLQAPIDLEAWRLVVRARSGEVLGELTLADVQRSPHVDLVAEHKCIEGWSTIARWTGARFADVMRPFDDEVAASRYVGLATPDHGYYVGLERSAAMHPQTLLVWALAGEPLTSDHGAPLRLVTPNHYGIKSIKRVGTVEFSNSRPRDFWAERGYDWYSRF